MYLKPASVVNRVYLSLSIHSFRLVRLHFCTVSAPAQGRLILASSPASSCWPHAQHLLAPSHTTERCWDQPALASVKKKSRNGVLWGQQHHCCCQHGTWSHVLQGGWAGAGHHSSICSPRKSDAAHNSSSPFMSPR